MSSAASLVSWIGRRTLQICYFGSTRSAAITPRLRAPPLKACSSMRLLRETTGPSSRFSADGGADRTDTNQCLFWGSDEIFERLARRYLAEGFRKLKVRIGVSDFDRDLRRLRLLRELGGMHIEIAVDANGSWDLDTARHRLGALEPIGIAYVEQPTRIGNWAAVEALASSTSIPIMLDEGLSSDEDAERLMRLGPPSLAHLKIVKLGGPRVVIRLARRLKEAGIAVMIGQMNEGSSATALAAFCTMAVQPAHAELYGAYGLIDDATSHVSYSGGQIVLARECDLGAEFNRDRCNLLWELRSGR